MKKLLVGITFFFISYSVIAQSPQVKTNNGIVEGVTTAGVSSFKGIPYAAPPVGEYRWRPPQPVSNWEGVRGATEYGANCAQSGWGGGPGTIAEGSSEDCLFLNLWVSSEAEPGDDLPVMVWIHGGAFVGGSGAGGATTGESFASEGVILVTINYRLGRLGHFAFPRLSDEHPDEPKGSYAFMDQIASLQWIKDNITAFGGNPNNVTIFGFSSGGVSVHSLMTIPAARGLFHKAISESGGGRDGVLTGRPLRKDNADPLYTISAETIGVNFARKKGIEGTDEEALEKLRALSVAEVVDDGQESDGEGGPRIYSGPILDGSFVVETAESAYKANRQANIPLIIGNTSAEIGGGFINNSSTKDELFSLFGEFEDEARAAFDPKGEKEFNEVITKFNTNWAWGEPARLTARSFVASDSPTYMYLFSYVPEAMRDRMRFGAGHGSEIPFVFNNLNTRWGNTQVTDEEKKIAKVLNSYWVNFAKTGNPNGEGLPEWPGYNIQNEQILEIEYKGGIVGKPDPRKERLDVINKGLENFRARIQSRGI
jgi:para-nitrobenzyl esterase